MATVVRKMFQRRHVANQEEEAEWARERREQ
jgi:hypothetical protein